MFSAKINLLYLLYATAWRCCLDNSGICLPIFSSRTYPKLHNIFVAPKIVKKVITNLDSSEVFGPDFLPVVVLKNCEPELSYILAELFNICLKESCFPDCCKVGCPCFWECWGKVYSSNYRLASLFSMISKVFEKLVNNRLVDHLEKCNLFSWFPLWF